MDNNYISNSEQRLNSLERKTRISTTISIITVAILIYTTWINYFGKLKIIHNISDITIDTLKFGDDEIDAVTFELHGQIINLASISVDVMWYDLKIEFDDKSKGTAIQYYNNISENLPETFAMNANESKSFKIFYYIKLDENNYDYFKELESNRKDFKIKYNGNFEVDRGFNFFNINFFGSTTFSDEKIVKIKTYS